MTIELFQLAAGDWVGRLPSPLRCVVTSLGVHHLDAGQKRELFFQLAGRVEAGGALIIADVVAPGSDRIREAHMRAWNRAARRQSQQLTGSTELFERAIQEGWGCGESDEDDIDKPDRLFDQLKWLEEAGFRIVDCFWMRAGFAVYGGYR